MNVELLLKVRERILEEPLNFSMSSWFTTTDYSPCGTAACIGGHAVMIMAGETDMAWARANLYTCLNKKLLDVGLTGEQQARLFYHSNWPVSFHDAYVMAGCAGDYALRAQVAAERIDHFIATEGAE